MGLFQWAVRQSAEVDSQMVSVERIVAFSSLPSEPALHGPAMVGEACNMDLRHSRHMLGQGQGQQALAIEDTDTDTDINKTYKTTDKRDGTVDSFETVPTAEGDIELQLVSEQQHERPGWPEMGQIECRDLWASYVIK